MLSRIMWSSSKRSSTPPELSVFFINSQGLLIEFLKDLPPISNEPGLRGGHLPVLSEYVLFAPFNSNSLLNLVSFVRLSFSIFLLNSVKFIEGNLISNKGSSLEIKLEIFLFMMLFNLYSYDFDTCF